MSRKAREIADIVREAILESPGVTNLVFGHTGGGHQRADFYLGGRRRFIFFPSTASDGRSALNARAFARRKCRQWALASKA